MKMAKVRRTSKSRRVQNFQLKTRKKIGNREAVVE